MSQACLDRLKGMFMVRQFNLATGVIALTVLFATVTQATTKVACVGNSITEGYGIWDEKKYPEHLQDLLGSEYEVQNFGHSSQMFRKNSTESYWNSAKFTAAYNFAPDIVIIELGTNDSKYYYNGAENYYEKNVDHDEMLKDYEALIDTFAHQPQSPTIYATLQPYAENVGWFITDTAIVNQINPIIKEAAENKGAKLIDLHSQFNNKEWFLDDMVHPNKTGAEELAKIIADAILINSSTTKVVNKINHPKAKFSFQKSTISVDNFVGKISIYDLNGNLVQAHQSSGHLKIELKRQGTYIVKAGAQLHRIAYTDNE